MSTSYFGRKLVTEIFLLISLRVFQNYFKLDSKLNVARNHIFDFIAKSRLEPATEARRGRKDYARTLDLEILLRYAR